MAPGSDTDPARVLDRRTLVRGAKFDFVELTLAGRNGERLTRQFVRHPGAVVVLPIMESSVGTEIVFVRNVRHGVGKRLLELPAGTLEPDEDPAVCAARELIEEAGYEAARIEPLRVFYTTPGMTNELMHAFVATGLTNVGQRLEPDEDMEVVSIGAGLALDLAESGELVDAKSMLTLLLADRRGLIPGRGRECDGLG